MLEIKIDADKALQQFDELTKNLAALPDEMSTTFTAWQSEDMHRHFPKVDGSGESISTMIYPRSQLRRTKNLTGGNATRRRSIIAARRAGAGQHKPILRPELFEQLCRRMADMLKEAAKWQ